MMKQVRSLILLFFFFFEAATLRSVFSEQTAESFKDSFVSTSTAEEELCFGIRLMKIYTQMLLWDAH